MCKQEHTGALDWGRLAAAVLVVCIHTGPFSAFNTDADFLLTRVLARLAVPYFFMVSAYFSLSPILSGYDPDHQGLRKLACSTGLLYLIAALVYLPVSMYAGHFDNLTAVTAMRLVLFDGIYYHLWYLPALLLGALLVCLLSRILRPAALITICMLLYLLGLAGDSYYGLLARLPALQTVYSGLFQIFSYTRNGIFFAPLFLALGTCLPRLPKPRNRYSDLAGFLVCLAGMAAEALTLRILNWPRHDSMYLLLPPTVVFLMRLLISLPVRPVPKLRRFCAWLYILHPLGIVILRAAARLFHAQAFLLDNSLIYFLCVLCSSSAAAYAVAAAEAWIQKNQTSVRVPGWKSTRRRCAITYRACVHGFRNPVC